MTAFDLTWPRLWPKSHGYGPFRAIYELTKMNARITYVQTL